MNLSPQNTFALTTGLWGAAILLGLAAAHVRADETTVAVRFSGGHDIGRGDFGRPVALIAAALGVQPEVFREAFTGVTPARGRGPTRDEARRNKTALLKVLAPQGVTNERLDEVSDYYRFRPDRGELWPTVPAKAHAIVEQGQIKRIVVTAPGSGYCSAPQVHVEGFPDVVLRAELRFSKNLKQNGAIAAIEVVPAEP